jgi:hypothetical protein
MRPYPGLGLVNFALVSAYFVPAWGHDALHVLTSPYNGFEDRAHAVAAIYFRDVFDLGLAGMIRTSEMLAGLKMVMAAAFLAYLIELARALATRREPNRQTVDVVLLLALATSLLWIVPTVTLGDAGLVRQQATQFLLLVGAAVVITIERHIAAATQPGTADMASAARAEPAAAPAHPHGGTQWGAVAPSRSEHAGA